MEQELISKKDLLDLKGISYGQLYRWKRKNLIPEEWFIKKSSFTGQETFFPKEKILSRIDRIVSMKEETSLEDLADIFSPSRSTISISSDEIIRLEIASKTTIDYFKTHIKSDEPFPFLPVLFLHILEKLFQSGDLNQSEGKDLLRILSEHSDRISQQRGELLFLRKLGVPFFLISKEDEEILIDPAAKVVARISFPASIDELKTKIK